MHADVPQETEQLQKKQAWYKQNQANLTKEKEVEPLSSSLSPPPPSLLSLSLTLSLSLSFSLTLSLDLSPSHSFVFCTYHSIWTDKTNQPNKTRKFSPSLNNAQFGRTCHSQTKLKSKHFNKQINKQTNSQSTTSVVVASPLESSLDTVQMYLPDSSLVTLGTFETKLPCSDTLSPWRDEC